MDKASHAARLRAAMASRGFDRKVIADATGRSVRSVTGWTTGQVLPDPVAREALRRLMPGYDEAGDPVEFAIMSSDLTEDRRYELVGVYKRLLRQQAAEDQAAAG